MLNTWNIFLSEGDHVGKVREMLENSSDSKHEANSYKSSLDLNSALDVCCIEE